MLLAPGRMFTTAVDINDYPCSTAHTHEVLLQKSAEQQGLKLKGKLHGCDGCSAAKGYRAPVKRTTDCRSFKKMGRVFVDLSGKKPVKSVGGKQYTLIIRDDKTRITWEYFLRTNDEAWIGFEQWLADIREFGTPEIVRSDDGGEFKGGRFGELCRRRGIKQEFASADRPQVNGVAERGLTLIEKLAMACGIQSKVTYSNVKLPAMGSLWAEAHNYACDVLNRTATTSNPGYKSPYEEWYGRPPLPTLKQWLMPCFYRAKRNSERDAQAQPAFCCLTR